MKIKVISLNLWHGGELMDNILAFLKEQNADFLMLQEVYNGGDPVLERKFRSVEVLKQELGYENSDFAPSYRDFDLTNGQAQRGNAVLSKFPILDRETVYFSIPYNETYRDTPENFKNCPRNLEYVKLRSQAGEINVFNVHGPWDLAGDDYSQQRQDMEQTILKGIEGKSHVIVGGDTNATANNPVIKNLNNKLTNVFGNELTTTFNMRHKTDVRYATAAVDYIFVSEDFEVIEKSCPDVDVSDHFPLIAVLIPG
jgi:endonuclease/exonuclease/phosphatase family metal-dependent hydrolase